MMQRWRPEAVEDRWATGRTQGKAGSRHVGGSFPGRQTPMPNMGTLGACAEACNVAIYLSLSHVSSSDHAKCVFPLCPGCGTCVRVPSISRQRWTALHPMLRTIVRAMTMEKLSQMRAMAEARARRSDNGRGPEGRPAKMAAKSNECLPLRPPTLRISRSRTRNGRW